MRAFIVCTLFLLFQPPATAPAAQVNVFAAASLTDSLKEIAAGYKETSSDRIAFNFAASSFLARQIEEGAPADVFFSADEAKMDQLAKRNLIVNESRRSLLSNSLAIVVASDATVAIRSTTDLTNAAIRRIAVADPKTVPAGIYAKQHLIRLNLWSAIASKVVPTDNVRAALTAVESGNVEAAIVYKTDAAISKRVTTAYQVPPNEGPAISYAIALLKEAKQPGAARRFLDHLKSPAARRVFEKHGFIVRHGV